MASGQFLIFLKKKGENCLKNGHFIRPFGVKEATYGANNIAYR
ncbi:hypothetical protein Cabys_1443 [Caldithrix abyssi DSM 13497]|uniref:Uncharacterized protein n=1 Tax=Caldithrix abyssi DSM 13497 TaxID=880073 RepID=A0A1J1C8E4_CALAY|nr:hypothetical protein Cabys_1443 [Caldithrix abyssi DSM 13497]